MNSRPFQNRLERCNHLMEEAGLDLLILTKPSNMFYLTGDGRLCAYAMVTKTEKLLWVFLRPMWKMLKNWPDLIILLVSRTR